ncbi:acylneuraminate cytidylyltransferase family protein [Flavobacteriaceae bacterium]|nr:acylneuraminate cytidylyltransferase family protein [Flavobacteriaceae bacterium]
MILKANLEKQKAIVVIPARGGSKGIPKKNLVKICGKPLIAYAIEASLKSKVSETWVSTDNDEIANIAMQYGAKIMKRPAEISGDKASSEDALLHFTENNNNFKVLVFIQATCPFIEYNDINRALSMIKDYDSIISVSKFDQFLWRGNKPMYDIQSRKRRQDREPTYIETGSMFVTKKENLLNSKNRISGKIGFVDVPKWRSIDIDTLDDLKFAEKIMLTKN